MDFPAVIEHPPIIGPWNHEAFSHATLAAAGGGNSWNSSSVPGANAAQFYPFRIKVPYLVKSLWWYNGGSVAGNVDVGIYTLSGCRLTSSGAVAQSGTSVLQKTTLGTAYLLGPNTYYMAISWSSGSATNFKSFAGNHYSRMLGAAEVASSAHVLPATVTLATPTNGVFLCGLARVTVF